MTLFEYVAIAFSLLFSFTAMRLIGGLPAALDPNRRYWVHATLVVGQLFATAAVFWFFWSYSKVAWTFPRFLLALANPALVYYNTCALVPENPRSIESWRGYYFSARMRYFSGVALWGIVAGVGSNVLLVTPLYHPLSAIQASALGIGLLGLSTAKPRVHAAIALVVTLLYAISAVGVLGNPDAFTP